MKTFFTTIISLGLIIGLTKGYSQSPEQDEFTYAAYLDTNASHKALWKKAVAEREKEYKSNSKDLDLSLRLALAQFGLLSATMRDKDEDLFDEYVDRAEEQLEDLSKNKDKKKGAEAKALLASVYGFQLGYSPWKGMYLGPKSGSLMEEALKENNTSPLIWKLYGNSKLFTPETWGGDVKEAINAYQKSINLYEADAGKTKSNWCYIDTMAMLGQAYLKTGDTAKAIAVYEKALAIEPSYGWIKYKLLPQAKK